VFTSGSVKLALEAEIGRELFRSLIRFIAQIIDLGRLAISFVTALTLDDTPRVRSLRFQLREETGALHAKLDATIGDLNSLDGYRLYLSRLFRFRELLETMMSNIPVGVSPRWRVVGVADAIKRDLEDIGSNAPTPAIPGEGIEQRLRDPAYFLGACYVLEGSSLGARLIYQRAKALGLTGDHGARHLSLQINDRDRWPRFLAILESHEGDAEATMCGAIDMFEAALRALAEG
jgi:heme oxygenase